MLSARDGSLAEKLLGYSRLNLLIIDDLGYMSVNKEQANLLFRLVSMHYEIEITERIIEQSKKVVYGNRIIPDRIVSVFDPEARSIKKGKLKAPTEFSYKTLINVPACPKRANLTKNKGKSRNNHGSKDSSAGKLAVKL